METERCRVRDLGLSLGCHPPGTWNAITDVPGVRVGHATILRGKGRLVCGQGPIRTGVTAILPNSGNVFQERVVGGAFVLNGSGEVSGLTQVQEWGLIETPILLTNSLAVGSCSDACVRYLVSRYPGIGAEHDVVLPLVGECDDSWLNDIAGRHVHESHVFRAIEEADTGPVAEGNVGGGTGMMTCDFSGGIGTSSRVLARRDGGYTIGVLVMSNFGRMADLRMDGLAVGRALAPLFEKGSKRRRSYGSIIAVAATDAPLSSHQLQRLAKRVGIGIGRAGSYAAHHSGEIVLAFSTANRVPRASGRRTYRLTLLQDAYIDPVYVAAVEATEEAILNALCMARTMDGVNGHVAPALPLDRVRALLSLSRLSGSNTCSE